MSFYYAPSPSAAAFELCFRLYLLTFSSFLLFVLTGQPPHTAIQQPAACELPVNTEDVQS